MSKSKSRDIRAMGQTTYPALEDKISKVLNEFSQENDSNTPDFILAQYMLRCLTAWNTAMAQREVWYGRTERPERPGGRGKVPVDPGSSQLHEKCLVCHGVGVMSSSSLYSESKRVPCSHCEGTGWAPDETERPEVRVEPGPKTSECPECRGVGSRCVASHLGGDSMRYSSVKCGNCLGIGLIGLTDAEPGDDIVDLAEECLPAGKVEGGGPDQR